MGNPARGYEAIRENIKTTVNRNDQWSANRIIALRNEAKLHHGDGAVRELDKEFLSGKYRKRIKRIKRMKRMI